MGFKVSFMDSIQQADGTYLPTYGVTDLNTTVANLVGGGVAPFTSAGSYSTTVLNNLTSALVTSGTNLDGLKVSVSNGNITVGQGIGYFSNGVIVTVDSGGVTLTDYNSQASTVYVYFLLDMGTNECKCLWSHTSPTAGTDQCLLKLAEIDASGTVKDVRTFAKMKVASDAPHQTQTFQITSFPTIGTNYQVKLNSSTFSNMWMFTDEYSRYSIFDLTKNICVYGAGSDVSGKTTNGVGTIYDPTSPHRYMEYKFENGYLVYYTPTGRNKFTRALTVLLY